MSDSLTPTAAIAEENGSDDEKEEEQVTSTNQKKEDAKVEKELDRVTDRVDEEEIGSENIGNVKFSMIKNIYIFFVFILQALTAINDKRHRGESKRKAEQAELANVKIRKDDVDFIVQELELPRSKAEKILREHHGDVIATLKALVNA
jgi:NACalpha-BTF3-like transcription factor